MKKIFFIILAYFSLTAIFSCTYANSFKAIVQQTKEKISSLFGLSMRTELIQKDIPRTTQKSLIVENRQGAIKIKTDWNQNTISLKAIKKASSENLAKISISVDTKNPNTIKLQTVFSDETIKGSVDYILIIPKQMTVHLKTTNGTIKVKRFDGQVWAQTESGPIEITHVTNKIVATINESGSISIDQSQGMIEAATHSGNIKINNAKDSVVASTENGNILLQASGIPATGLIKLNATGSLQLYVPNDINAHLKAQATHGNIISDLYVTLAPQTTRLNNQSWASIRRNIEGTLGSGDAEIHLTSLKGSINIHSDALC